MSTNVVDDRQNDDRQRSARRYTVAELLARERATATAIPPAIGGIDTNDAPREYLPVAHLLRREGVEFAGDSAPTDRFPAAVASAPARQATKEGPLARTLTVSRTVALFGLTVAGFIALKPAVASSPVADAPRDSGRVLAAPQGAQPGSSAETTRTGGGATPTTTAAGASLDAAADAAPPTRESGGTAPPSTASDAGARNSGATATSAPAAPPPSSSSLPAARSEPAVQQPETTRPGGSDTGDSDTGDGGDQGGDDQGGSVLDPVLDPVTGTISGVLEVGGGLLGR
ncbi:hypothetical protein [Qaidamihabitans albus]|uniref:hypothetical protein n=1 Tax=Qaidamihabitans albus TaxID=2795733 RepID=UPI0018F1D489|nr:hypothetical protein [Qaidamihabitans albus]